jgi:hypothetical protein
MPVSTRFQLHAGQQLVRRALVLIALGAELAQLLHAPGEPVAHALELIEAEQ